MSAAIIEYREDIDALRGCAVILVLFNHVKFPGFERFYRSRYIFRNKWIPNHAHYSERNPRKEFLDFEFL